MQPHKDDPREDAATDDTLAKEPELKLSVSEQLIAGSLARVAAGALLHPIDVIRTRRQAVRRSFGPVLGV